MGKRKRSGDTIKSKQTMAILIITVIGFAAIFTVFTIAYFKKVEIQGGSKEAGNYVEEFEDRKRDISSHIKKINGSKLVQQAKEDIERAIQDGRVKNEAIVRKLADEIENYSENDTGWKENPEFDPWWSKYRVTKGFTVNLPNAKVSEDMETVAEGKVHILLEFGYYGPKESEAEVRNEILYNNIRRYMYEFFRGRISVDEIDRIIDEVRNVKDPQKAELIRNYNGERIIEDAVIVRNYGGKEYIFEYEYLPQIMRIIFAW